jgi:hypothetical protein
VLGSAPCLSEQQSAHDPSSFLFFSFLWDPWYYWVVMGMVMVNWNANSWRHIYLHACIVISIHVKTDPLKPNVHSIFVFTRTISARFLEWCLSTQFQSLWLTVHVFCLASYAFGDMGDLLTYLCQ